MELRVYLDVEIWQEKTKQTTKELSSINQNVIIILQD